METYRWSTGLRSAPCARSTLWTCSGGACWTELYRFSPCLRFFAIFKSSFA